MPAPEQRLESYISRWWNTEASPTFAHLNYTGKWLESEGAVVRRWQGLWLGPVDAAVSLRGKHVAEYGVGGGLLGQTPMSHVHACAPCMCMCMYM